MFAIKDGIGTINDEPIPEAVVDYEGPGTTGLINHGIRRMRIPCKNGYSLSIVWSSLTYSDNSRHGVDGQEFHEEANTAEIAVMVTETGLLVDLFNWADTVQGYQTPQQVVETLVELRRMPPVEPGQYPTPHEYRRNMYINMKEAMDLAEESGSVEFDPKMKAIIERAIETYAD